MSVRYNEKGKYFTEVVTKDQVDAIIQTTCQRLQGKVHIRPGMRLKDSLNDGPLFIAVTDGSFLDPDNQELDSFEFLTLNRKQIVWIIPVDKVESDIESGGQAG